MTSPENTSTRPAELHLLGAFADGMPDYIEGMEAAGQRQLVASDVLPVGAPWDELTGLGFVAGELVDGDPLFRRCTLPEGWKREGSDHAMWSYIVDERGVRRVSVFYKAAFYDRNAFANIVDPGRELASHAVYGDAPPALPDSWPLLTEEERHSFVATLEGYLRQAEESPEVYGSRAKRARAVLRETQR